jgi:hypothetical protein
MSVRHVGLRLLSAVLLASVSAAAMADRVILAPTGTKILYRHARAEFMFDRNGRDFQAFLGFGITREVEAEVVLERFDARNAGTFNVAYNLFPVFIDQVPGINVGVRDALDRTRDGRLIYLALTHRLSAESDLVEEAPVEVSFGGGFGRRAGAFVGVRLPITDRFRLLAEHDVHRITAGFEYQHESGLGGRLLFREGETLLSVRFLTRF